MSPKYSLECANRLALIRFFPAQNQVAIVEASRQIESLCDTDKRADWLVDLAVRTLKEWQGFSALREVYSQKYRPADGKE